MQFPPTTILALLVLSASYNILRIDLKYGHKENGAVCPLPFWNLLILVSSFLKPEQLHCLHTNTHTHRDMAYAEMQG